MQSLAMHSVRIVSILGAGAIMAFTFSRTDVVMIKLGGFETAERVGGVLESLGYMRDESWAQRNDAGELCHAFLPEHGAAVQICQPREANYTAIRVEEHGPPGCAANDVNPQLAKVYCSLKCEFSTDLVPPKTASVLQCQECEQ